jgi:hypothetical protein
MSSYQELVDSPDVDIVRTQLHPLPPTRSHSPLS